MKEVYGEEIDFDTVGSKCVLCPKNDDCAMINKLMLAKIPGELTEYVGLDT
jgi:hypothetical protein